MILVPPGWRAPKPEPQPEPTTPTPPVMRRSPDAEIRGARCLECGCLIRRRHGRDECGICEEPTREICDVCPEEVSPDARCTHGRSLCAEHLTYCKECRDEFADDGRLVR